MVLGLLIAGTAVAAGLAGVATAGLGLAAAQRVGSAYGRTVEQMYEQQRLASYQNQQGYYNYPNGGSNYYNQPNTYQHGGGYYGYRY